MRRLYRSRDNVMVAGVAGGLGEYLEVDPTVIRLAFLLGILLSCGTAILFYIIAMIVIPVGPGGSARSYHQDPPDET